MARPTVLFLIVITSLAAALQINKATYQFVDTELFEKQQQWAVIEIEFDSQPYYIHDGVPHPFTQFRVDLDHITLSALLSCPSNHINYCNDDKSKDSGVLTLAPSASPIQDLLEGVANNLEDSFAKNNPYNWYYSTASYPTITPRANVWAGVVQFWERDDKTQTYKSCLTPEMFVGGACPFYILPPLTNVNNGTINVTGICDSNGANCLNYTQVTLKEKTPACSQSALATAYTALSNTLNYDPFTINNPWQLYLLSIELQSRSKDAAILGCRDLFGSLATFAPITTTSDTTMCHKSLYINGSVNPDYVNDPCCNEQAEFYSCCTKRPVSYKQDNVDQVKLDQVKQTCSDPLAAVATIYDVKFIVNNIDQVCGTEQSFNDEAIWFYYIWGPLFYCLQDLNNHPCSTSQECESGICSSGKCVAPLDDPSPQFSKCLSETLDPITTYFWKYQWGLPASATQSQFTQAFRDHVYNNTCIGTGVYNQPRKDRTQCLAQQLCNWNSNLNQSECLSSGYTDFCGFCISSSICWSFTVNALCVLPQNQTSCTGTWNTDYKVCTDTNAKNSTECASVSGSWFDGYYNTKDKCDLGYCPNIGYAISPAQCTSSYYCTRNCPQCTSSVRPEGSCFVYVGTQYAANCTASGASYFDGWCNVPFVNRSTCETQVSFGTWITCQGRNQNACTGGAVANYLGCYWDDKATCANQTLCEAQGECDDAIIHSNSDEDSACFQRYNVNWEGKPSCTFGDENWYDIKFGCINPNLNVVQCSNKGHRWISRSYDKNNCEKSKGCKEPWNDYFTYKNQTPCANCGGDYVSLFNWNAGQWLAGEVIQLTWKARNYTSINKWAMGLDFSSNGTDALLNILLQPLGAKIGYWAQAHGFCRYSVYLTALERIAAACGSSKRSEARAVNSMATVGKFKAWKGEGQYFTGGWADVQVYDNTFTADSTDITVKQSPLSTISKSSSSNSNNNVYVFNSNNVEIGQVISDGYQVQFQPSSGVGTYTLCVNLRTDVQANSCYTNLDFASGSPLRPLNTAITYSDSDSICGNVDATSTVYAVKRLSGWETVTSNSCASSSTTGDVSAGVSVVVSMVLIMIALFISL